MTRQELLEDICATIGEVFHKDSFDFPCFCGKNPVAKEEMDCPIKAQDLENWEALKELLKEL